MTIRNIRLPVSEETIRELRIGDELKLTGTIVTARDMAHKYLVECDAEEMRPFLKDGMVYHCGPIVKKQADGWSFVAAGPTTSKREEPYEAKVMQKYGVRGVIGKGGMGKTTLEACKRIGAVYLHAIGGLAVLLAQSVKRVSGVYKLDEFGAPEAMWIIEVEDFPVVVTMDSTGQSLHETVLNNSTDMARKLAESL